MEMNDIEDITAVESVARYFPDRNPLLEAKDSKRKEVNEWIRFGISMGVSAAMHPFEYAKTLIQLGYEPLPPSLGKSLLGRQILLLPNIFQYTNYIRKTDGFWGCYTGLTPQLLGLVAAKLANRYLVQTRGFKRGVLASENSNNFEQFKDELKDEIVLCAAGAVIIHPFHLISVRMMAEFVGHENLYTNLLTSIKEILKNEGIGGFFNGLVPRLLWDVGCLILTATTLYLVNKYILKDKVKKHFSVGIVQYVYANMLYPFHVTSTCMCVSGSRLAAGQPPIMPIYQNWMYCISDLSRRGELKRGNSVLLRSTSKIFLPSQKIISDPQVALNPKTN